MAVTEHGVLVSPLDARDQAGNVLTWPWGHGMDDQVALDVGNNLDEGETLIAGEVEVAHVNRIAPDGKMIEQDVADDALVGAAIVSGSVILQRITGLDRERNYRLEVLHGPAGNKRLSSLLIHCAG